jgi:signal transduction histidine kinase/ligand-binding sensor domain-containing protein
VQWSKEKKHVFSSQNCLISDAVRALTEDSFGNLYIGFRSGEVQIFSHNNSTPQRVLGLPERAIVSVLFTDKQSRIWAGTSVGIFCVQNARFYAVSEALGRVQTQSIMQDISGAMWFATTSGIMRLLGNTLETMRSEHPLGSGIILSLMQDREGTVWIGTGGSGLHRLHNGTFSALLQSHTTPFLENTFAIAESANERVWTGGINGIRWFRNGLEYAEKPPSMRGADKSVYSFLPNAQGMWVGGGSGLSLFSLRGTLIKSYSMKDGLSNNVVLSLAEEGDSVLWIGTQGGLNRLQNGRFQHFGTKEGLSGNIISSIHCAKDGAVWIGTWDNGVFFLKNGVITRLSAQTPTIVVPKQILAFLEENDGTIWISSYGGGLLRVRNGEVSQITSKHGLYNDVAYSMQRDTLGFVWMSCNKGIFRVRLKDLNDAADGRWGQISSDVFGAEDGMKNAECNGGTQPSAWRLRDGTLAFATVRGIALVHPSRIVRNTLPPMVVMESIIADTLTLGMKSRFEVAPETKRLELHYTATSLKVPEKVRFRYMLEGYDNAWIEAGTRRVAFYTNLPRNRQYRFRVIACNNDGIWNEAGAEVQLYLKPHVWETWWAIVVYVIASIGALFGLFRYREKVQQRRLRERFREREAEIIFEKNLVLEQANTRLAGLNGQLSEANTNLSRLNEEKTDILGVVAHNLKNPIIGIQKMAYSLEGQAKRLESPPIQESAAIIKTTAERMFQMIQQLLKVHAAEYGAESLVPTTVNVKELAEQLVRDWQQRAKLRSLNIQIFADEASIYAFADPFALLQVLENLLSNAIKASHLDSTVEIHCRQEADKTLIAVKDYGIGLNEEQKQILFTKSILLRGATKAGMPSEEHSSGLGLYIVKKLVDAMNGEIRCESAPEQGASFTVILPTRAGQMFSTSKI